MDIFEDPPDPPVEPTETVPFPGAPARPAEPGAGPLARGASVGRYLVLGLAGTGGMGVVYAGYDPELDRKVALKLLRPDRGGEAARRRLVREAQAIARLSHPNVVTVYDAGTVGDEVFIAMELVEGQTLRHWLKERPRAWREVLGPFLAAGRGLAAAHAAGLVHRDFKPANVLLGRDGRARVADFGLARAAAEDAAAEPEIAPAEAGAPEGGGGSSTLVTEWGVALGTPSYMAPEQVRGERADARSDQFGFCVALWEALYGEHPFAGEGEEVAAAIRRGRVREAPAGSRVPETVRRALLRGLASDPTQRHGSMDSLLAELSRDPAGARRRVVAAAGAALAAAGLLAGASWLQARPARLCRAAGEKVAEFWSPERKSAVHAGLRATGAAFAEDAWRTVERVLDVYAAELAAQRRDSCHASRVRGEQSEDLLDRRMFCLDQRLREMDALASMLARADEAIALRAVDAAGRLSSIDRCTDVSALLAHAPPPADPEVKRRLESVQRGLSEAKALSAAGRESEALERLRPLAEEARAAGYPPVVAEVLYETGFLEDRVGESAAAEGTVYEAYLAAERSGHDEMAVRAAVELAWIGGVLGRIEEARRWLQLAEARVEGIASGPSLQSDLYRQMAVQLYNEGKLADSERVGRRALELARNGYGTESRHTAAILSNLGVVYDELGRWRESVEASTEGLEIRKRILPPGHPDLARSYNTLGNGTLGLGRDEDARKWFELGAQAFEDAYGSLHPNSIGTRMNLALLDKDTGRLAEAEQGFRRALASFEQTVGPDHQYVSMASSNLSDVLFLEERWAEALEGYERARRIDEVQLPVGHPTRAWALQGIGRSLHRLGRVLEAVEPLSEALALREAAGEGMAPDLLAESRFELARALWDAGRDRDRALRLARQAARGWAEAGHEPRRAEAETWLRERGAAP